MKVAMQLQLNILTPPNWLVRFMTLLLQCDLLTLTAGRCQQLREFSKEYKLEERDSCCLAGFIDCYCYLSSCRQSSTYSKVIGTANVHETPAISTEASDINILVL